MTKDEYQELYYKYQDMCDDELDDNLKELYNKRLK